MARKSRILALARLLKDEKALSQIGSNIVRSALADAARIAGGRITKFDDPPWDDAWVDFDSPTGPGAPPWNNHWSDSGPSKPSWDDVHTGWTNHWDQGTGHDRLAPVSLIAERVQPIFVKELSVDETKVLKQLNIIE